MKNLTIKIEVDDEMTKAKIEEINEGLTSCEYAYMIYRLLLQLYKCHDDDILISVDTFLDKLKERGIL